MKSMMVSLILALAAHVMALPAVASESQECRRYINLLVKYEREGVTEQNSITGAIQRLTDEQAQLRIYRLKQLIRQKCRN